MNKDIFLFLKAIRHMNLIKDIEGVKNVLNVLKTDYDSQLSNLGFEDKDYDSFDNYYYGFDWNITNISNCGVAIGTTKELVIDAISMTIADADSNDKFINIAENILNVTVIHDSIFDMDALWNMLNMTAYEKIVAMLTIMTNDIDSMTAYLTHRLTYDYKFKNATKILIEWSFINNGNVEFDSIAYLLNAGMTEKEAKAYMIEFIEGFDNIADLSAFIIAIN